MQYAQLLQYLKTLFGPGLESFNGLKHRDNFQMTRDDARLRGDKQ